jgi:hypothetical protein
VQQLLKENNARRGTKFSVSGALLKSKLFDDRGNRMGPTFSSKNGVRYRFYVSTALRGRKQKAGSVSRISAPEIENLSRRRSERNSTPMRPRLKTCLGVFDMSRCRRARYRSFWKVREMTNAQLKSHGQHRRRKATDTFSLHHLKQMPIRSC